MPISVKPTAASWSTRSSHCTIMQHRQVALAHWHMFRVATHRIGVPHRHLCAQAHMRLAEHCNAQGAHWPAFMGTTTTLCHEEAATMHTSALLAQGGTMPVLGSRFHILLDL